jgi:hypothetical protein
LQPSVAKIVVCVQGGTTDVTGDDQDFKTIVLTISRKIVVTNVVIKDSLNFRNQVICVATVHINA